MVLKNNQKNKNVTKPEYPYLCRNFKNKIDLKEKLVKSRFYFLFFFIYFMMSVKIIINRIIKTNIKSFLKNI